MEQLANRINIRCPIYIYLGQLYSIKENNQDKYIQLSRPTILVCTMTMTVKSEPCTVRKPSII